MTGRLAVQALALALAGAQASPGASGPADEGARAAPEGDVPDFGVEPYVMQGACRASYRRPGDRRNARLRRRRQRAVRLRGAGRTRRILRWARLVTDRALSAHESYATLVGQVRHKEFRIESIQGRSVDQVIVDDVTIVKPRSLGLTWTMFKVRDRQAP